MKLKHLFALLVLICLFACSDNSEKRATRSEPTQFGLYIENGPRQGFQYFDANKTEYSYRYCTITLTNDSVIPVKLEIYFPETSKTLIDNSNSKVFLLPRHLTPEEQHADTEGISAELKKFLDFEIDKPVHLSKVVMPGEKCVVIFGVLTDIKYPEPTTPYETALLTSREKTAAIALKLKINDTFIIPCGQFSYVEQ